MIGFWAGRFDWIGGISDGTEVSAWCVGGWSVGRMGICRAGKRIGSKEGNFWCWDEGAFWASGCRENGKDLSMCIQRSDSLFPII